MAAAGGGGGGAEVKEETWVQLLSPEEREYYWWRCDQMVCNNLTPELLKVHIKVLHDKAKGALEKHLQGIDIGYHADFRHKFKLIFEDEEVSLASLNVKSLQVCVLLTMILILKGKVKEDFSNYVVERGHMLPFYQNVLKSGDGFFRYSTALPIIAADELMFGTMLRDADDLTNVPICVILGEMTMGELLGTFVRNIYLCGVVFDMAWADGQYFSPLEYLHHDIGHMKAREATLEYFEQLYTLNDSQPITSEFVEYLMYGDVPEEIQKKCYLYLFILVHEVYEDYKLQQYLISDDRKALTRLIPTRSAFLNRKGSAYFTGWNFDRYQKEGDLGGLIKWLNGKDPTTLTPNEIYDTLLDCCNVFIDTWNAYFESGNAVFPNNPVRKNYQARLIANAASWNASRRLPKGGMRKTRRSKRSKRFRRKSTKRRMI